jgi:hypothetical protein
MTTFRKRCRWIEAGDAHWYLCAHARTFSTLYGSFHEPVKIVCPGESLIEFYAVALNTKVTANQ